MISIKNFVRSKIEVEQAPRVFSGFRTTLYFVSGTINAPQGGADSFVRGSNFVVVKSIEDFDTVFTSSSGTARASAEAYFNNGGSSLCLVVPSTYTLEGFKNDILGVLNVLDDFFFVTISSSLIGSSNYSNSAIYDIANFCSGNGWSDSDKKSFNSMRLCLTTNSQNFVTAFDLEGLLVAVKYSTAQTPSSEVIDAALLVGAYFSQIDTQAAQPILDYNFTPETLPNNYEDIDQSLFEDLTDSPSNGYYNVICKIANRILNVGGDYCSSNKVSISLDFGAACIERDLDYANIEMLFGKLPLNATGQAKLIDAIRSQLTKYVDSGFLEQDATYTGETKKVTYNGKSYTIIKKGDTLAQGYKVFYVPINAINAEDKSKKRFPYIYVALQSVHGARLIEVNGSIL